MKSPQTHRKIGALDWVCLRAIAFYQRQLSTRKGYRCAYGRFLGGGGCSGFARGAIALHGLRAAMPRIKARFGDCKLAGRTLRAQNGVSLDKEDDSPNASPDAPNSSSFKRKKRDGSSGVGYNWNWLDVTWCFCLDMTFDCGPHDVGCCDCSPCD